jgi:PTS system cellobiose-specific IIB component
MKAKSKKIAEAHNVPLDVIPMADYGRCNGKAVLELAKKLAAK